MENREYRQSNTRQTPAVQTCPYVVVHEDHFQVTIIPRAVRKYPSSRAKKALSCFSKSWDKIMIHESPTCGNSCFVATILGGRDLGNILTSGFLIPGTCGPNWQWHPPESCITHLHITSTHLCLHSRVAKSRLTGGRTSAWTSPNPVQKVIKLIRKKIGPTRRWAGSPSFSLLSRWTSLHVLVFTDMQMFRAVAVCLSCCQGMLPSVNLVGEAEGHHVHAKAVQQPPRSYTYAQPPTTSVLSCVLTTASAFLECLPQTMNLTGFGASPLKLFPYVVIFASAKVLGAWRRFLIILVFLAAF